MPLFLCPMRVKPALAVDLGSTIRTSYRNRHRDQAKLGTWVQLTVWGFPLFIGESHWHPRGTQEVSIPENKSFLPQETKEKFPGKLALCYLLEDKCSLVQWWLGETESREINWQQQAQQVRERGQPSHRVIPLYAHSPPPSLLTEVDCHHRKSLQVGHLGYSHIGKQLKRVEHKEEREPVKDILFLSAFFCSISICKTCVLEKVPTPYMDPWLFLLPTFKYTVVPIRSVLPSPPSVQIWCTLLNVAQRPGL